RNRQQTQRLARRLDTSPRVRLRERLRPPGRLCPDDRRKRERNRAYPRRNRARSTGGLCGKRRRGACPGKRREAGFSRTPGRRDDGANNSKTWTFRAGGSLRTGRKMTAYDYIHDGNAIYEKSFAIIRAEA